MRSEPASTAATPPTLIMSVDDIAASSNSMNETVVLIVAAWCGPRHEAQTQTSREKCPDPAQDSIDAVGALTAADGVCCAPATKHARNETCLWEAAFTPTGGSGSWCGSVFSVV